MAKAQRICSIPDCNKPVKGRGWCAGHYHRWTRHGDPLGGRCFDGEPLKWIEDVALKYEGDECLTWPFGLAQGRGKLYVNKEVMLAHRYICIRAHGEPTTPEHLAAHSCGKGDKGCVSPHHLSWKTYAENQADRIDHGTHNRGERHGNSKLTREQVLEIRSLEGTASNRVLGEIFGVSGGTISAIHRRKLWSWL